jgi:PKD repeat protein
MKKILFFLSIACVLQVLNSCTEKENGKPEANFTITPGTGTTGTTFTFDASSSKNAAQYRWDWDNDGIWDEIYSTESVKTHNFSESGTLAIKLEVMGENGNSASTTKELIVDLGPAPTITKTYYIQAKVDGNRWVTAQSNSPGISMFGTGTGMLLNPLSMSIDFQTSTTNALILGLNGQNIYYPPSSGVEVDFLYKYNSKDYSAYNADSQVGGHCQVTNVTNDGTYMGYPAFLVEGNFKCFVSDDLNFKTLTLSEGKFAMRMVNDN